MRGLLAVARREVADRKLVFLAAAVLSLVPLAAPVLPGVRGGPEEVRLALALTITAALGWGAALVLGATIYVRDLAEGTLSFYLSRPLSPAAVLGGKMLGAAALVYGASAIVALPTALLGDAGRRALRGPEGTLLWAAVLLAPLAILPVAHALNLALRARTRFLALDLAGVVCGGLLLLFADRTLRSAGLPDVPLAAAAVLVLVPLATFAAGFAQAARARTDLAHAHRVLSTVTWSILLPLAALLAGAVFRLANPSVRELRTVDELAAAPGGRWVELTGRARWRWELPFTFLVDASGPSRAVPLGFARWWPYAGDVVFSADGTRAAWLSLPDEEGRRAGNPPRRMEVRIVALDAPAPRVETTTLPATGASRLALSPDGDRIAVTDGPRVSVFEIGTGRTLAAAAVPGVSDIHPLFLGSGAVRLSEGWGGATRSPEVRPLPIYELDVARRRLERTGTLRTEPDTWIRFAADASGSNLLVLGRESPTILCDARTGSVRATLVPKGTRVHTGGFLSDARVVLPVRENGAMTLRLFGAGGAPERTIALPPARFAYLGGQPAPGLLCVGLAAPKEGMPEWSGVVVDLAEGRVVRELPGLAPASGGGRFTSPRALVSGENALLFSGAGRLVRVDPRGGPPRRVLP